MTPHKKLCCLLALSVVGIAVGRRNQDEASGFRALAESGKSGAEVVVPESDLSVPHATDAEFAADERAHFHPHGAQICLSGCALSHHPTGKLSRARFRRLVGDFGKGDIGRTNLALDTLLFFGRQTRQLLDTHESLLVSERHMSCLKREIARSHVQVSVRLLNETSQAIATLPFTKVPLDRRHEFTLESAALPPLKVSGTVKRVGVHHLWTRL